MRLRGTQGTRCASWDFQEQRALGRAVAGDERAGVLGGMHPQRAEELSPGRSRDLHLLKTLAHQKESVTAADLGFKRIKYFKIS